MKRRGKMMTMTLEFSRVLKNVSTQSETLSVLPDCRAPAMISERKKGGGEKNAHPRDHISSDPISFEMLT